MSKPATKTTMNRNQQGIGEAIDPMVASESRPRQAKTKSYDYYDYYDYSGAAGNNRLAAALRLRKQRLQQQQQQQQSFAKRQSLVATTADLTADGSTAYGSYSHHGYHDCDNGISLGLLLTALLGIGVMFFTLFTKITMAGKRKKRDLDELIGVDDPLGMILERFQDFVFGGNMIKHIC